MTHEQFCYWLQGFSEVTGKVPTAEQWKIIQDHLQATYVKVTPLYPNNQWPGTGPGVTLC
jgi:hypothetical protein